MRIIAAFVLLGMGLASADGQELQQIASIAIPGNPINQFGALTIDPASGLGDSSRATFGLAVFQRFLKNSAAKTFRLVPCDRGCPPEGCGSDPNWHGTGLPVS